MAFQDYQYSDDEDVKNIESKAHPEGPGRIVKRRASRACHSCRGRKVRCNVVKSDIPCHNCRVDDLRCVVTVSKRRKRFLCEDEILSKLSPLPISECDNVDPNTAGSMSSLNSFLAVAPVSLDFKLSDYVPRLPDDSQDAGFQARDRTHLHSQTTAPTSVASLALPKQQFRIPALPKYVHSLPNRMGADEIDYLQRKGALEVPELRLRNGLLRNYVQFVHPCLPLLDLQVFLETIVQDDAANRISLMLLNAVMLAASAYADTDLLRQHGYQTRKAARQSFFQKAKLLYDHDYDDDRISTVQTLVLLTYWYETPDDLKDPSYWIGTALSFANTIGLNRAAEQVSLDSTKQKLRKRLWWSCFMRDQLIALSMRKPPHVKGGYDIPMLTHEDFDAWPVSQEILEIIGICPVARNSTQGTILSELCIEQAKLCLCISDVLDSQYCVIGNSFGGMTEPTMVLTPKKLASEDFNFINCEQALNKWHVNLSKDCHFQVPKQADSDTEDSCKVLLVHRAILRMVYLTASSALHRPRITSKLPLLTVVKNFQHLSRQRVREAAAEITVIAVDLYQRDLVRYLPPVAVTVTIPAVLVHIMDIRSGDANTRDTGLERFHECMQVIQKLREMYYSADAAFLFLEAAVHRMGLKIPNMSGQERETTQTADNLLMFDNQAHIRRYSDPLPSGRDTPDMELFSGDVKLTADNNTINEDLGALNYFNMWPHIFQSDDSLSLDLDVDWALDFSADAGVNIFI